jgi:hypothetical protein
VDVSRTTKHVTGKTPLITKNLKHTIIEYTRQKATIRQVAQELTALELE